MNLKHNLRWAQEEPAGVPLQETFRFDNEYDLFSTTKFVRGVRQILAEQQFNEKSTNSKI